MSRIAATFGHSVGYRRYIYIWSLQMAHKDSTRPFCTQEYCSYNNSFVVDSKNAIEYYIIIMALVSVGPYCFIIVCSPPYRRVYARVERK